MNIGPLLLVPTQHWAWLEDTPHNPIPAHAMHEHCLKQKRATTNQKDVSEEGHGEMMSPPPPDAPGKAWAGPGPAIPLCPVAAGATPRQCQAPRQRSGRLPPQTHQTPVGHCPCPGPAAESQRSLEEPGVGGREEQYRRSGWLLITLPRSPDTWQGTVT